MLANVYQFQFRAVRHLLKLAALMSFYTLVYDVHPISALLSPHELWKTNVALIAGQNRSFCQTTQVFSKLAW